MQERVLLVEDVEPLCIALSQLITRGGYECDCATSARDANRVVQTIYYSMAVVDAMLGKGESGVELIAQLSKHHPKMRFVLISANPVSSKLLWKQKRVLFLQKPFRPDQLIDCLKKLAKQRAA